MRRNPEKLRLGIPEEEKSSGWAIFQEALTVLDLDLSTSAGGEEQSGGIWRLRPHFYSLSNWSVRFLETFVCIKTEDLGLGIPEEEKSSGWAIFQEALTVLDLDLSTSAGGEEQSGGIWKLRPHFYSPSNRSVRFLETFVCIKTEDLGLGIPEEKKLRLGNLPGGLNRS
uniref:Uncharacterized protein n=1 Tax=Nelumbo nucifera TaxID=4432 RepID=A0A822XTS4_NELNU|nr:TPA_asm: hypothetical protein HUJ06_023688 [Nelumbo nucifera]